MLESFYTNLEALVYDEEVKEIEDLTLPKLSMQDEKLDPFLEEIEEQFGSVSLHFQNTFDILVKIYLFIAVGSSGKSCKAHKRR